MDMAMWRSGRQNVHEFNAWQKVDTFSTLLHDVCRGLDLGRDKEWLLYLLKQAGQLMREAVKRAGSESIWQNACSASPKR
jgi:hypothetical protein